MCKIEFNVFTANVLYCSSPDGAPVTKICYVKFDDSQSTGVALHLNNTVFIDKALIIVPVMDGKYIIYMPTCENPFDILKCSQICLTLCV